MTPPDEMFVSPSEYAPSDVMARFRQTIEAMGMIVFSEIDFTADAAHVGLELEPTILLIFGNPRVGTLLLRENPSAGIDLPLKALAWTHNNQHWFGYNKPSLIVRRHGIQQQGVIEKMSQALKTAASVALASPSERQTSKEKTS
jgi:uncharacterized protein (DUF302 family)